MSKDAHGSILLTSVSTQDSVSTSALDDLYHSLKLTTSTRRWSFANSNAPPAAYTPINTSDPEFCEITTFIILRVVLESLLKIVQ